MSGPISTPNSNTEFYGDFTALSALKRDARADNPQALHQAAQQFESLFTEMMLKSMRAANFGDSLTGSDEVDFYQGMFDQQLSLQMAKGKGMGLADMLVQQLARSGLAGTTAEVTKPNVASSSTLQRQSSLSATAPTAIVATTGKVDIPTTPDEFVRCIWPHAQTAAKQLGVDPAMLVAQAALETGWGKHIPENTDGSSSMNLFGIKAGGLWQGASTEANTLEYEQGKPVQQAAHFRSYDSMADCFADYAQLLGSKARYQGAINTGGDAKQFAQSLQRGGYATDPAYSDKLQAVVRSVSSLLGSAGS
ncbi:MAG: flagellar assembly peptidoglycan hydrolase FlgJ [Steroidobacteraceae bacterium]